MKWPPIMRIKLRGSRDSNHSKNRLRHTIRNANSRGDSRNILQKDISSRKIIRGALASSYHIPSVTFHPGQGIAFSLTAAVVIFAVGWRFAYGISPGLRILLVFSAAPLLLRIVGWVLSCFDRPYHTTPDQIKDLRVVISVPAFNEAPETVDACMFALVNQTRPPDLVDFVDDGSTKVDYSTLEKYWAGKHGRTTITWRRKTNEGKRRAHSATFRDELNRLAKVKKSAEKVIFITVDSDTILSKTAIEEGLQRFADPTVMSVAGTELGYNHKRNLLTLIECSLQEYAQVVVSGAWSVSGDMFTNRGPFALIRASAFQKIIDVYANEVLFGRRVELADDSLTALAGSMCGKSVQQISAVAFTMWPEKLSHHSRQRTRWARGRTVRNFWRLKYYPISSYMWWYTMMSIYSTLLGVAFMLIIIGSWPHSEHLIWRVLVSSVIIGWVSQLRTLALHRSDDTWRIKFLTIALHPIASLWSAIVLTRIIRLYGTITFLKQGWTTRQNGVENTMRPQGEAS